MLYSKNNAAGRDRVKCLCEWVSKALEGSFSDVLSSSSLAPKPLGPLMLITLCHLFLSYIINLFQRLFSGTNSSHLLGNYSTPPDGLSWPL